MNIHEYLEYLEYFFDTLSRTTHLEDTHYKEI